MDLRSMSCRDSEWVLDELREFGVFEARFHRSLVKVSWVFLGSSIFDHIDFFGDKINGVFAVSFEPRFGVGNCKPGEVFTPDGFETVNSKFESFKLGAFGSMEVAWKAELPVQGTRGKHLGYLDILKGGFQLDVCISIVEMGLHLEIRVYHNITWWDPFISSTGRVLVGSSWHLLWAHRLFVDYGFTFQNNGLLCTGRVIAGSVFF
ncbi:hypothetical protein U1Q18_014382 [Sarracenia purpurea var. burkii]